MYRMRPCFVLTTGECSRLVIPALMLPNNDWGANLQTSTIASSQKLVAVLRRREYRREDGWRSHSFHTGFRSLTQVISRGHSLFIADANQDHPCLLLLKNRARVTPLDEAYATLRELGFQAALPPEPIAQDAWRSFRCPVRNARSMTTSHNCPISSPISAAALGTRL